MPTQDESTREGSDVITPQEKHAIDKVIVNTDKRLHPERWDGDQSKLDFDGGDGTLGLDPPHDHKPLA